MTLYGRIQNRIRTIWSDPDQKESFGSERIRIRNTANSPIKSMLSSVSREESGPSC